MELYPFRPQKLIKLNNFKKLNHFSYTIFTFYNLQCKIWQLIYFKKCNKPITL